jgi:3-phenylpropionate/cinnamic acid dioxygenase small subunit
MKPFSLSEVTDFLYREAYLLDTQQFEDWLELFHEDAQYWVPAWKSEHETTSNPKSELSLIYYATRAGLEDRVWRVRSGRSVASKPLPRTQHSVSNVMWGPSQPEQGVQVLCNWTVHQFRTKSQEVEILFGHSEYALILHNQNLCIRSKKVTLLNDYLPAMLDYYNL